MKRKHFGPKPEEKRGTGECRVLALSPDSYAECLCSGPNDCPYALPFGYAFLCQDPRFNAFLRKVKPATAPPAS